MFNRTLEMKLVKKNKKETPQVSQTETKFEMVAAIGYHIERTLHKAGMAALAYVVLDTVRQVALAKVNQP